MAGGVNRALEIGVVDDVIEPAETRRRIAEALAAAPAARGAHGNIPLLTLAEVGSQPQLQALRGRPGRPATGETGPGALALPAITAGQRRHATAGLDEYVAISVGDRRAASRYGVSIMTVTAAPGSGRRAVSPYPTRWTTVPPAAWTVHPARLQRLDQRDPRCLAPAGGGDRDRPAEPAAPVHGAAQHGDRRGGGRVDGAPGAPATVERRQVGLRCRRRAELQGQDPGDRLDQPVAFGSVPSCSAASDAVPGGGDVRRHEQQVVAGVERADRGLAGRPLLGRRPCSSRR